MKRSSKGMAGLTGLLAALALTSCQTPRPEGGPPISLARDGATAYAIVTGADATPVDAYAARELALYMKQITGAEFAVVSEGTWPQKRGAGVPLAASTDPLPAGDASGPLAPRGIAAVAPAIFVGLSAPALKRLGKADPLVGLDEQEHVARSVGADVFLYGKGIHGNLYSVMEFLENSLGWRWYSIFEQPVLPHTPTVLLEPFHRTRRFDFAYRKVSVQRGMDYFAQQGMNMGFDARIGSFVERGMTNVPRHFVSEISDVLDAPHTLLSYISPAVDHADAKRFPWLEKANYFEAHPEFFSLWENGQRVPNRQLCFSNAGLRAELTRRVLENAAHAGARGVLAVTANDTPGAFCYCPECKALEEKYQSPGGPLYDYVIELCGVMQSQHPGILIKTLAYRRAQTQKPPVLPAGERLPENLLIDFAPIEDNYFADWTHPDERIQETYADLQAWGRITTHLWAWLYPNPWRSGAAMPVGNVERLIINMRKMHAAGVEGVFTDHNSYHSRAGWSELQAYLFYRLCQDVNVNTDAIIEEFTDHFYGPAAALLRTYLKELEAERKTMLDLPPGVTYRSSEYDDRTFPYLTAENIHRWQGYFDRMEAAVAERPERERTNVRLARRELDLATLLKWFDLRKAHPDSYADHNLLVARIAAANATRPAPAPEWEGKSLNREWHTHPHGEGVVKDFVNIIESGGEEKPLPARFKEVDPALIRTFLPTRYSGAPRTVADPEAAFGYAIPVDEPGGIPFPFGFHQVASKTRVKSFDLEAGEIVAGAYRLYEVGEVPVVGDSVIYFGKSWATLFKAGERLHEPGADNIWEAYVSLKFDGPSYGGKAAEDQVLVDRVIMVRKSKDQFDVK